MGEYAVYKRHSKTYRPFTLFGFAQPVPAYVGLLGSVLVVFGFTSATWWIGEVTFSKIAVAYAAVSPMSFLPDLLRDPALADVLQPIVLLVMWLIAKIVNRRWWVQIDNDFNKLSRRLRNLQWLKPEQRKNSPEAPLGVLGPQRANGTTEHFQQPGQVSTSQLMTQNGA